MCHIMTVCPADAVMGVAVHTTIPIIASCAHEKDCSIKLWLFS